MWGFVGKTGEMYCSPDHSHFDWENDEKTAGWDPHGTPNLVGYSLSMESLEYHLAALEWRDRPDPPIIMEKN